MREFEQADHWDKAALHYEATAHPFTARYAEAALARIALGPDDRVLDLAAGTGALALAAARTGARILATDFSPGMVARIATAGLPNVEARVMDGQALTLPDAGFDAVFSIFGVIMFPDWRKGLAEMARVTRPGGYGVVATWQDRGAATFLLLGEIRRTLFPGRSGMTMPEAVSALSDPAEFRARADRCGLSRSAHRACHARLRPGRRRACPTRQPVRHVARLDESRRQRESRGSRRSAPHGRRPRDPADPLHRADRRRAALAHRAKKGEPAFRKKRCDDK